MARKQPIPSDKLKKSKLTKLQPTRLHKILIGTFLMVVSVLMVLSFLSFLATWKQDQSALGQLGNREVVTGNLLNKLGLFLGDLFMYRGFGVAAFSIPVLLFLSGIYLFAAKSNIFSLSRKRLLSNWFWGLLLMAWTAVTLGFFFETNALLGGMVGYELNDYLQDYTGMVGTALILAFLAVVYLVIRLGVTPEQVSAFFKKQAAEVKESLNGTAPEDTLTSELTDDEKEWENATVEGNTASQTAGAKPPAIPGTTFEINRPPPVPQTYDDSDDYDDDDASIQPTLKVVSAKDGNDIGMEIEEIIEEELDETDALASKIVADFGEFDPKLELSKYQFPPVDLLKDYSGGKTITINEEELQVNKDRIVETLKNYNIGIAKITATIGPTVTLYEIVPDAGVRISKIKNLEDDIALSLAALGIRIIAPMPGKGTIGIEVPNQNPSIVSMRSVIASPKFKNAEMELPIAFGKNISNETFVADLAKMPHLLMAGATGQGKSVGLNAILTSLLYAKHPAEVKFVLVDPKKVELTLFNKIERHYLAKLPDSAEAIITDNSKVINTLNSLCVEMDSRYDLLKDAMCRNLKEYNAKFKARKLNPNEGHRYLPYIVLVVDEFADLIMTAGKEVETPIARLAQLARAIGIHLIIATQRPSVNVITGMIKANFPARIAFRVMSKIDSRTILDAGGADQLIGRGDMLYTSGNDLIRIQCAFVDTPEVEKITDFIGAQKGYADAYLLPEFVSEDGGTSLDISIDERDSKFREAAEIVVTSQQGSASLLQRKLKLGYNRAGRIIDQLEAAGIVGNFEGSKARQVLITDLTSLDQFFKNEES
jgi:S-DNA-T family DNA segregation ATPase FtsK/SpoIIIE